MARTEILSIEGEIVAMTTATHKEFGNIICVASNIINEDGKLEGRLTLIPHECSQVTEVGTRCYP